MAYFFRLRPGLVSILSLAVFCLGLAGAAWADSSELPVPRFVSLRAAKVNLRTGPGVRYPVDWVYTRKGLPVEIISEYETWRRIRDWEGTEGWMHRSMLSGTRNVLTSGKLQTLRREPSATSPAVAHLEANVIGKLLKCAGAWCRVEFKGFEGWIERDNLWGVYPDETVE
jgi:SH3-like domain-containing protein